VSIEEGNSTSMKFCGGFSIVLISVLVSGCMAADEKFSIFSSVYDFSTDTYGWQGDFADYKAKDSLKSQLLYGFSNRPANISNFDDQKSIMLSGNNLSNNLFMFLKKKVDGLIPNKEYTVVFEVEFGANVAVLSSEDSIYLKVGAAQREPKKIIQSDYYRINIDKGIAAYDGGNDMTVIGSIGTSVEYSNDYTLVKKSNFSSAKQVIAVRANNDGEVWLVVGTDSAYKGSMSIYYTSINVVFSASK
jgi:hypothetical protein